MRTLLASPAVQHLVVGLAIIGSASALAASGTITGDAALGVITGVGGVLLGTTATTVGNSNAKS